MLISLTPTIGQAILSAPGSLSGMLAGGLLSHHDELGLAELQGVAGAIGMTVGAERGVDVQLHTLALMVELPPTPKTVTLIANDLSSIGGDTYSVAATSVLMRIENGTLRIHDRVTTREQLLAALFPTMKPTLKQIFLQEARGVDVVEAMLAQLEEKKVNWRKTIHITDEMESLKHDCLKALQTKDRELAKHLYDQLFIHIGRAEKKYFDIYLDVGMALAQNGLLPEAEALLVRAIVTDENSARAWKYLGYVSSFLKKHKQALDSFDKAIQIECETCEATLMAKGVALLWAGELEKGLKILGRKYPFLIEQRVGGRWRDSFVFPLRIGQYNVAWKIVDEMHYAFRLPMIDDLFHFDPPPLAFFSPSVSPSV